MSAENIAFSVQASPRDRASWLELARRVEALGFDALVAGDHPGTSPDPIVALAAAASVTERIRLGPYVANTGIRDPVLLAAAIATLDVVSDGRAFAGLGAGHTPSEWTATGRRFPGPRDRAARLLEFAQIFRHVLDGHPANVAGEFLQMQHAHLAAPRPVQARIPMYIGGNHPRLLEYAAGNADVVAISGTGRTLEDGHSHEVRWSDDDVQRLVGIIRDSVSRTTPPIEALVQHVSITETDAEARQAAVEACAVISGLDPDVALTTPFMMVGTAARLAQRIRDHAARWGISRYVVRPGAIAALTEVRELLDA
jgi:probable F420-dependent oxidoreductase